VNFGWFIAGYAAFLAAGVNNAFYRKIPPALYIATNMILSTAGGVAIALGVTGDTPFSVGAGIVFGIAMGGGSLLVLRLPRR